MSHAHYPIHQEEDLVDFPISAGALAGLLATGGFLFFVLELVLITGQSVDAVADGIVTIFFGPEATFSPALLFLGGVLHVGLSGVFGAIFALAMPRFPRAFWIIAGLIYGIVTGFVACFILSRFVWYLCEGSCTNYFAIMGMNAFYGLLVGAAAAIYGLWRLPGD